MEGRDGAAGFTITLSTVVDSCYSMHTSTQHSSNANASAEVLRPRSRLLSTTRARPALCFWFDSLDGQQEQQKRIVKVKIHTENILQDPAEFKQPRVSAAESMNGIPAGNGNSMPDAHASLAAGSDAGQHPLMKVCVWSTTCSGPHWLTSPLTRSCHPYANLMLFQRHSRPTSQDPREEAS